LPDGSTGHRYRVEWFFAHVYLNIGVFYTESPATVPAGTEFNVFVMMLNNGSPPIACTEMNYDATALRLVAHCGSSRTNEIRVELQLMEPTPTHKIILNSMVDFRYDPQESVPDIEGWTAFSLAYLTFKTLRPMDRETCSRSLGIYAHLTKWLNAPVGVSEAMFPKFFKKMEVVDPETSERPMPRDYVIMAEKGYQSLMGSEIALKYYD
jgi:hypothetical protein